MIPARALNRLLTVPLAAVLLAAILGFAQEQHSASPSLLAQTDEVLQQMSETTGLPIRASLRKEIISRSEVQKYLTENLHAEMTPRQLHIQEATLQAFGLVSRDFHLEKFLITFYTEQAAGFYDPRRKTMFIADWPAPEMQRLVLAHELTHALQDQNFNLDKFLHAVRANDDATNARQAVAEGHATAAMMQSIVAPAELASLPSLEPLMAAVVHTQLKEFPAFSNAPFFFRMQALFPYIQGMGFMQRGLRIGGWDKLNSLFADPPATTKEIFAPHFYFDRVSLPSIRLPRPTPLVSAPGVHELTENTMGELGCYALVGQFISEEEGKSLGTSWLGDRYVIYEWPGTDRFSLIARTRWSSAESALAFFRSYHTILSRKYPDLAPDKRSGTDLFVGLAANGQAILLRDGDECRWAEGIPAAQTAAVLNYLHTM